MTDADRMVAWLREALDAAQADAEAAGGGEWRRHEDPSDQVAIYDSKDEVVVYNEGWPTEEQQVHIARHSPAAVLRRIAADRKQLAEHAPTAADFDGTRRCLACGGYNMHPGWGAVGYRTVWPCPTIRNLAEGWGWTEEEQR